MKICNRCRKEKESDEFGNRKDSPDGKKYYCKECAKQLAAEQRNRRPNLEADRQRKYYHAHRKPQIRKAAKWQRENRDHINKRHRENGSSAASTARYRAAKRKQTPVWASEKVILSIYRAAARLTKQTGVQYEVDHIEPIQGRFVSGLHVECNLRVITSTENKIKGNRVDYIIYDELQDLTGG